MIYDLISRLKRFSPLEEDAFAAETLYEPAWRRVVLIGTLAAVLAFVMGLVFETLGPPGRSFDRVTYSLSVAGLLALYFSLVIYPRSLKAVTSILITSGGAFFVAKAAHLLFFAPAMIDIPKEMTESFFWVPIMYVLAYLIPGLALGRLSAVSINILLLLLSGVYTLTHLGAPDWDVLLALGQLNLANLTTIFVISNFSVYKDLALRGQAKGETMARLAHTDALTGLHNRLHFERALRETLDRAQEQGETCAVVFIDLDRFKSINDTLGHAVGDRLLARVAERLREAVRAEDLLARVSGDEFVLLLKPVRGSRDADAVVQNLHALFGQPFDVDGRAVTITASIGFCLFPDDSNSAEALLKHADTAMYQVKARGRAGSKRFSAAADADVELRRRLERELRGAAERGEFELVYQPLFDLRTGEITKLEALLRWRHPELGLVPPSTFIPVAEEGGLIGEIGTWVLVNAMWQNVAWQHLGFASRPLAVNVSPLQFAQADFFASVKAALDMTGLSPSHLEIELTEGAVLKNTDHVFRTLSQLRKLGVRVAIDDFGTGYSSLAYLRDLPIDTVKIDQSFVRDLGRPRDAPHFALALVQAIMSIAQTLDLEVVAEGIETAAQAELLRDLGVPVGQGHYFAKPLPASEVQLQLPRQQAREVAAIGIKLVN